jgi:multiple sugar transport system permease protein
MAEAPSLTPEPAERPPPGAEPLRPAPGVRRRRHGGPGSAAGSRRRRRPTPSAVLIGAALTVFTLGYLAPVAGVVFTSLRSDADIAREGLWAMSSDLSVRNYLEVWFAGNARRYMWNTLLVTLPATAISITLGSLCGYVFAKLRPAGTELLYVVIVAGLFVPPQILLVPLFRMFNTVGLYDTLWPMIIVHSAYGLSVCTLVMRNFFSHVPDELREAAIVDGAAEPLVLLRVILPLSRPALAALATLQFTWIWNDFLYPLVFTRSDSMRTVMVGVLTLQGQYSVAYGAQAAMSVVASLPTLVVFLVFQRQFVQGLAAGAIKG